MGPGTGFSSGPGYDVDDDVGVVVDVDDAREREQRWAGLRQRAERLARVAGNPPACSRATLQLFH